MTTKCREYFGTVNCNDIRGAVPASCQAMSVTECQNWAQNLGKNFTPNNDVFCGVVDSCPVGCYVHNSNVYYGASTNNGQCTNQRVCVQNQV